MAEKHLRALFFGTDVALPTLKSGRRKQVKNRFALACYLNGFTGLPGQNQERNPWFPRALQEAEEFWEERRSKRREQTAKAAEQQ